MSDIVAAFATLGPKVAGIVSFLLLFSAFTGIDNLPAWMYYTGFILAWSGVLLALYRKDK